MHGHVLPRTRARVVSIIEELWDAGAGGVLVGCTELELLVTQADVELPVFRAPPCTWRPPWTARSAERVAHASAVSSRSTRSASRRRSAVR